MLRGGDRPVLVRLLLREHQPGRLLAGDAGHRHERQRPDVHRREPDQSAPERPADSAGGLGLGLASQLGQSLGTLYSAGARGAVLHAVGRRACSAISGGGWVGGFTYVGSRGRNLPVGAAGQQHPDGVPVDVARARRRARDAAVGRTSRTRSPACCRAARSTAPTIAAPAAAAAVSAVRQRSRIEGYEGSDRYNAGTIQLQKRFSNGNSITTQYTRSSLRDKLNYLNPQDGELEDRVSPNDRPNRFSIGSGDAAAVRPRRAVGPDWNGARRMRSSAAGR